MSWVYNHSEQVQHLKELHSLLLSTGCAKKVHLSLGTFLGAFRQGALNTRYESTWDDLDFCFLDKDREEIFEKIFPALIDLGWRSDTVWWTPNDEFAQITFIKGSDRLDFNQFILYPGSSKYTYWVQAGNQIMKKELRESFYTDIKLYNVDGVDFYGPSEGEKYCEDMYGPNWRIPSTHEFEYDYTADDCGIPWKEKIVFEKTTADWRK